VVEEVIRLKALMDDAGCRRIADTFNRLHAARHTMTVSKTWVAVVVRKHRLEIEERRREWKRRIPSPMPVNRLWGMDLTGKADVEGRVHPILGIVDRGSRPGVSLRALPNKATITILRALLDAIERYGKPWAVRTDNEAVFTSRLLRFALWVLGIHHQRTQPHCPWQNPRWPPKLPHLWPGQTPAP
jgi:transposase InsO family protein